MQTFVAYFRVSTDQQGRSGLGLEAQHATVATYLASVSPTPKLLAHYTEVESAKRNDRRELLKAMEHAKLTGSTLLIAKLDRLSRDAHFLLGLEKAGIDFLACDLPHANRLTIGIMAMVAEEERRLISERTKAALVAAKARGVVLGGPMKGAHLRGLGNAHAVTAVRRAADKRAMSLKSTLEALEARGVRSAGAQARELNERGIKAARGGRWTAQSVSNVWKRLKPGCVLSA